MSYTSNDLENIFNMAATSALPCEAKPIVKLEAKKEDKEKKSIKIMFSISALSSFTCNNTDGTTKTNKKRVSTTGLIILPKTSYSSETFYVAMFKKWIRENYFYGENPFEVISYDKDYSNNIYKEYAINPEEEIIVDK